MPETNPPIDVEGLTLAEIAGLVAERRLPPVETWNPTRCGDSEMRIARDGTWFHQGVAIARPAMVRLFSSVLRREPDGSYALVTPVEKLDILVEDAPFTAVELMSEGDGTARRLAFRLNTGEVIFAGPDHPLRFDSGGGGPQPYLHVRAGLEARVSRSVYYELAELAIAGGVSPAGVWSGGRFFAMEAAA